MSEKKEEKTEEELAAEQARKELLAKAKPVLDAMHKVRSCELALSDEGKPGNPFTGKYADPTEAREAFKDFLKNPEPTYAAARKYVKEGGKVTGSNDTERAVHAISHAFSEQFGTQAKLRI